MFSLRIPMSDTPVDTSKRTWLIASGCAGAVGGAFTAVPFVRSFEPSERAKAAGAAVEADISALKPGEKMTVEWRGKPVWIMRRTPEQLGRIAVHGSATGGSQLQAQARRIHARIRPQRSTRSIKPELLVVVGICTHLGMFAVGPVSDRCPSHPCPMTGKAASSALAMVPRSTLRDGFSRTSPLRTTWKCRRTCTCPTAGC